MFNMEFVELAGIINLAHERVMRMIDEIDDYEDKTYDDQVFLQVANILVAAFEKVDKQISPYLPEYTTGYLIKQSNGRFIINDRELSCGSYLELYYNGNWISGRVEHSNRYYFCNKFMDNPALEPGMKARTIA